LPRQGSAHIPHHAHPAAAAVSTSSLEVKWWWLITSSADSCPRSLHRYILLLQELQKLTPSKHKDYKNIGRALSDIKQMTDYINRFAQGGELFRKLHRTLTLLLL
jgi:hypothetical protein